jgi:hypothetical protein
VCVRARARVRVRVVDQVSDEDAAAEPEEHAEGSDTCPEYSTLQRSAPRCKIKPAGVLTDGEAVPLEHPAVERRLVAHADASDPPACVRVCVGVCISVCARVCARLVAHGRAADLPRHAERDQVDELQRSTTRCNAARHVATQHDTMQRSTTRCNAARHNATQHDTLQRSTTRCNAARHVATQHDALQRATRSTIR